MAAWPLSWVHPLLGAGDEPGDPRVRTEMDDGTVKMRRRVSAAVRVLPMEFVVTGAEWDTLLAWGTTQLGQWSLPFTIEDPHTDATVTAQFRDVPRKTLLVGDVSPAARRYRVRTVMEVLPS